MMKTRIEGPLKRWWIPFLPISGASSDKGGHWKFFGIEASWNLEEWFGFATRWGISFWGLLAFYHQDTKGGTLKTTRARNPDGWTWRVARPRINFINRRAQSYE